VNGFDVVTFCLADSQGSQAWFPHSSLAHDSINKKSKSTNELVEFNLLALIHIAKGANKVLGISNCGETSTSGCVSHIYETFSVEELIRVTVVLRGIATTWPSLLQNQMSCPRGNANFLFRRLAKTTESMCSKDSSDSPLTPGPDNLTLVPSMLDAAEVENLPEQYTDICAAESGRKSEPVEISANSSLVTE
jgi:hypothetical protein